MQRVQAPTHLLGFSQLALPIPAHEGGRVTEGGQLGGGEACLYKGVAKKRSLMVDDAHDRPVSDHDIAVP